MHTSDWIQMPGTRNEILNRFKNFLRTFLDEKGNLVFRERIRRMVECTITTILYFN